MYRAHGRVDSSEKNKESSCLKPLERTHTHTTRHTSSRDYSIVPTICRDAELFTGDSQAAARERRCPVVGPLWPSAIALLRCVELLLRAPSCVDRRATACVLLPAAAVANNPSLSLGLLSRVRVDICSPSAMRSILRFLMPWSGTGRRALGANGTRFARCVTLRVVRVRWDGSKFVQLAVTLAVSHTARCWSRLVEGRRSVTGEAMLSLLRVS